MAPIVSTPQELGKAIRNGESRIVVTGSLGPAVITIEAVGPVAWAVAIGAIGVAIAGVVTTAGTGGVAAPAGLVMEGIAAPALIATLGSVGTVSTAIGIAIAGGGVGTLASLRKYRASHENGKVVLSKR